MYYPAQLIAAEEGGFVVKFRDIPEAITQGDSKEEALAMAQDALLTAIEFYIEDERTVPPPSKAKKNEELVALPVSVYAKILLINELIAQQLTQAELARRLKTRPQEVQRIVDLNHSTKIDTIAQALHQLGKRLDVVVS
ncbi:MAG: type II toxin-antitoxin system HicB family antitoxin [Cardiobacteriaceae bacterium]|nr:type II toxin-antitoxin system HicB family antitoxin [Cardiobacteriaceae bacterium]